MIEQTLNQLYESYGYRKFRMTKFEPYDLYADNRDFLNTQQLITFSDLDGTLLALRPDVTLSIVKSNGGGEEKVYYNENVYRPSDSHYREILQSGVECLGVVDPYAEAEVIALACRSLAAVSRHYVLRISDAAFLQEEFSSMGLSEQTKIEVLKLFSMKNQAGLKALSDKGHLTEASAETLAKLMDLYAPFTEGVSVIRKLAFSNTAMRIADELRELSDILDAFNVLPNIYLDFSLVNSMDYYNGVIFQGAVEEIPFVVLTGGRYDPLPEKMGKHVGAIGFAMSIDLLENYLTKPRDYDVDVLLVYGSEKEGGTCPLSVRAARVMTEMTAHSMKVRLVRKDELAHMEHKIRAEKTMTISEAEKWLEDSAGDSPIKEQNSLNEKTADRQNAAEPEAVK